MLSPPRFTRKNNTKKIIIAGVDTNFEGTEN